MAHSASGLGVRPRGVPLPPGRLPADRARGDARGRRHDLRAAEGDRLRVRVLVEGEDDCRLYMQEHLPRLAGEEHHRGAAREAGRLRREHAVDAGAGRRRPRRSASRILVAGHAWPGSRRDAGGAVTGGRDRPGDDRVRARWWSRPARGCATSGTCSTCPATITVRGRDGNDHERPMWTYWCLHGGHARRRSDLPADNDGNMPPVIHVDTDAPLVDDTDGSLVTDELWGIYYKPDFNFGGVQGGAVPWDGRSSPPTTWPSIPTGPRAPSTSSTEDFERMWTSALAHCQKRFEGKRGAVPQGARAAGSARSRRTRSRCSTCSPRTSTWSPTRTTATR